MKVLELAEKIGISRRLTPTGTNEMYGHADDIERLYWAGFSAGQRACSEADSQADQSHRERIHAEIAKDIDRIEADFDECEEWLPQVIRAIAAGRIRHLTINY